MKKILLTLFIALGAFAVRAQEIKWMTFNEAVLAQKVKAKPIFMDVYTDWCGPCKMLDKNTFHDPTVAKYINDNFYAVKFDAEGNENINYKSRKYTNPGYSPEKKGRKPVHEFTRVLNIEGYPSMIIFDAKGEISQTIVGYHTAEQLMQSLSTK